MHRRIEIDCALSSMTPKAVPDAPLGALARQWYADADVETAAAIVAPTNAATKKRLMIALPDVYARNSRLSFREFNFPAHRNLGVSEGVENLLG